MGLGGDEDGGRRGVAVGGNDRRPGVNIHSFEQQQKADLRASEYFKDYARQRGVCSVFAEKHLSPEARKCLHASAAAVTIPMVFMVSLPIGQHIACACIWNETDRKLNPSQRLHH